MRIVLACSLGLACLCATSDAWSCGTSADGVSSCDLAEHDEATRLAWRVGATAGITSTALRFGGPVRGDESRVSTLATLAYAPTPRITLQAGAGAALGGRLAMPDGPYDFSAGPAAAVGASWRVIEAHPFVVVTSLLSFTAATTHPRGNDAIATGYEAFDLRVGAIVGTTLWNVFSPYALARVFGGPVFWRYAGQAVTGTDTSHFQIGAGFALALTRRFNLFAEGVPLGEQAIAGGLSVAL